MIHLVEAAALGASDRAALQGLIPLAGGLGAGTIFALFFSGRRRAGVAVFEIVAIVAVLVSVASTAYFAISLLHQDEAISDRELTQTAMPLVVAAFLLVFVSIFSRLGFGWRAVAVAAPVGLTGAFAAALLASASWAAKPGEAIVFAVVILAIGGLLGLGTWAWERREARHERRELAKWFARIAAAGYEPGRKQLSWGLPAAPDAKAPAVSVWTRDSRVYLDRRAWSRLSAEVDDGWDALADDEAQPPVGRSVLVRIEVATAIPVVRPRAPVRVSTLAAGETEVHDLAPNDDRLFEVTKLGLVGPARS